MLRACSGIVIRCEPLITTLLTSASLLRSSHDESRIEDDFTVGVANHVALLLVHLRYQLCWLDHYRLECATNTSSISMGSWETMIWITIFLSTSRPLLFLWHAWTIKCNLESCSKVLAVGRIFNSRKLMATSGLVKDTISIFDQEEIAISTCKISKVHFLFVHYK